MRFAKTSRLFFNFIVLFLFACPVDADEIETRLARIETFFSEYCFECHRSDELSGGLNLEAFDFRSSSFRSDGLDTSGWEKVFRRVSARQMPPPAHSRPKASEYTKFEKDLTELLGSYGSKFPKVGRIGALRRMTRLEYQNSIRDLLGVQIDAAELLPQDESSHGFDNITVENVSPTLMDRYVTAAQKVSRLAVGGIGNGPSGITVRLPADRTQEKHVEGLPFGTRGGHQFDFQFPQTGEYEIELKLTRDRDEKVEGLFRKHQIDVLIDRARIHQFEVVPPKNNGDWESRDFTHSDSHLRHRFRVEAGRHQVSVTFPKSFSSLEENKRQPFDASFNRHRHPRKTPAIYQISLVGPFAAEGPGKTESRRLVFGEAPMVNRRGRKEAVEIVSRLCRRAYRRPVTSEDLASPMMFFDRVFKTEDFEAAIESALTSILVNPNFLFKIEGASPTSESISTISQFELATRLSYFLWSSLPDETLLKLAEQGRLNDDMILAEQVERMLRDPKAESLVNNFAAQWLYLRNLESITPNLRLFPDFDDNLRQAFRGETESLVRDVIKNDHSVLGLIRSEFTYLNERLATHYGIRGVRGSHFRRVKLTPGSKRGGLLRHGSVLMVTSYATRTSPTIRGNWVLENLLGTPAPPPPPDVPNLTENNPLKSTSIRERLAMHREDPACASCHDLMDPVGFSLENYDAVGRWREFDGSLDVDSIGVLPDGSTVKTIEDLESGILRRPAVFVRTLAEKLMTFGLGRSVEPFDQPAIRDVVRRAEENEFRFSSIVTGIVLSEAFRKRSNE